MSSPGTGGSILFSLALAASAGPVAAGVVPSDLPEGPFPPAVVAALEDGAVVRSEPGFVYRVIAELDSGEQLIVDQRRGAWLRVRPQGWVLVDHVGPADARGPAPVAGGRRLRVTRDGSRLRGGPGTDHAVVGQLSAGDVVRAVGREGEWWELGRGGWVHGSLVEPAGPAGSPPRGTGAVGPASDPRRWSFMDLNGVMFEVVQFEPGSSLQEALRRAMDQTGVLESDWTFLRLRIGVPPGPFRFHYSPRKNTTLVVDGQGERYGNVFLQGPVEKLPAALRQFFLPQTVHPGEQFEGILLFRPTLDTDAITEVSMYVAGRLRTFYESP